MGEPNTRERILQVAEGQFVAKGIEKTQMIDIAVASGINRRTLYRYFPTKDLLAFEVEMIVMERIQSYMGSLADGASSGTGLQHVREYFDRVDMGRIENLLKFTAEFDRYFQNDYPDSELTRKFIESINPQGDPLFRAIGQGIADGSIRGDKTAAELYHFITQSFFAFFQRLILRRNHLKDEYCGDVDFEKLFKEMMIKAISA